MMLRPLERMRVARRVPNSLQPPFKRAVSAARRLLAPLWTVKDNFLRLGQELVVPALFVSGIWTRSAGFDVLAESFTANAVAAFSNNYYNGAIGIEANKTYLITGNAVLSSGSFKIINMRSSGTPVINTSGAFSFVAVAGASGSKFFIQPQSTLTGTISNISIREVLSASVYQDSAGTLPTTYGSTVGLLTDRSFGWELGLDLLADWDFASAAAWQANGGAAIAVSGGIGTASFPAGSNYPTVLQYGATEVGKLYEVEVRAKKNTSDKVRFLAGAVSTNITDTFQTYRLVYQAVAASTLFRVQVAAPSTVVGSFEIDYFRVRELRGNPLSQSTAGARPTLTRTPKALGPELASSSSATLDGSSGYKIGMSAPPVAGKAYRVTYSYSLTSGTIQAGSASSFSVGPYHTGNVSGSHSYIAVGNGAALAHAMYSNAAIGSVSNFSVREVLEWSPLLSFNGSGNFMSAIQNPIGSNLSQPYTIIIAGVVGAVGATRTAYGDSARRLYLTTTGRIAAINGGQTLLAANTVLAQGQPFVASITWDGVTQTVILNGVVEASAARPAPTTAAGAAMIGQAGYNAEYWNGLLDPFCVAVPFVMSDTDRKTFERAAAQRVGATYLG